MGGAITLIIPLLAILAFLASASPILAIVACIVAVVYLWSWLHMLYFARSLARQRLFVAALHRGEFEQGSPEAERYWHEMEVEVDPSDSVDVPNWITRVNMIATVMALVLLLWGITAYWPARVRTPSAVGDIAIVVSAGLGLFFVIGWLIDTVIIRLSFGSHDALLNSFADAKYDPRRRFILNILRPVILTVILSVEDC